VDMSKTRRSQQQLLDMTTVWTLTFSFSHHKSKEETSR
jgi:hypothetical protein